MSQSVQNLIIYKVQINQHAMDAGKHELNAMHSCHPLPNCRFRTPICKTALFRERLSYQYSTIFTTRCYA